MMQSNESNREDSAFEREEVLLGRVIDHEATPDDWAELERLGDADPTVWKRLAQAERAHARLSAAVEDAIAIAECVDLPLARPHAGARPRSTEAQPTVQGRGRGWGAFLRHGAGWAIAACLALVLGVQAIMGPGTPQGIDPSGADSHTRPMIAAHQPEPFDGEAYRARDGRETELGGGSGYAGSGVGTRFANYSPDDLWSGYVRRGAVEGRVLREMPSTVFEIRRLEGSDEYELLIERRVLERRVVSSKDTPVMRVYMDEYGEPVAVPVDPEDGLSRLLGPRESPV